MKNVKIYFKVQGANIRSRLMYQVNFFIGIFSVMCISVFSTIFVWILTQKFPLIEGWGFYELMFNLSFNVLSYSLSLMCLYQVYDINSYIRNAEFDRFLVRPVNVLLQFAMVRFNLNSIGSVLYAAAMLIYSGSHMRIWNLESIVETIILIACGWITACSFLVLISAASFRTMQSGGMLQIYEVSFDQFSKYPLSIFSRSVQLMITFLPISFIGFFPSAFLLGNLKQSVLGNYTLVICLLVAIVFPILSYKVWIREVRKYSSAGS